MQCKSIWINALLYLNCIFSHRLGRNSKFRKSYLPTQAFVTQVCNFHTELADVSRLRTLTWESRIALYIYNDATRHFNHLAGDVAVGVGVITPGLVGNI